MPHVPTWGSSTRGAARAGTSVACIAFVALLALALWAGLLWLAQALIPVIAG
jgi:hypothetical protein